MTITTGELTQLLDGIIEGDASLKISRPSKIEEGEVGSITFLANMKYEKYVYTTKASAILVSKEFVPKSTINTTLIRVDDVQASLLFLMEKFNSPSEQTVSISPLASIHKSAKIENNVNIGDFTVLKENVSIGNDTIIHDQVYIGLNVTIGSNCLIYPGVRLLESTVIGNNCIIHANTVLGSDGFGFSKNKKGAYTKIPQLGNVVIEDDVEIGANTVIDRGTMGSTILRKGVKFDNLVHIAHNVDIGEHSAIAAQCGIAGSTKVGKDSMMGGQVGVAGHIHLADGVRIQAKSGVASSVRSKNAKLYGYPAIDYGDYLRAYAGFKQLPVLLKKVQALEKKIGK